MRARSIGILLVVAALGCADDDAPAQREEAVTEDASHARGATADYARLFDGDAVRRIDLVMEPEARQQMLDNMEELIGKLGEGRGFGGPPPDPTACAGKSVGDSCEPSDPEAGESACVAFNDDRMFCFPKSRMMMMPGGGERRGGPLDLIGGDPLYVPVSVRFDDKQWEHVAMRYKGNSSLRGGWGSGKLKLGFRLNFDHFEDVEPSITDQRFFGFSEMTFSSAYNDPSLIRDKLAGELAQDSGLVSAHTAFYRVYVDVGEGPEFWGLYTMIEDPSDELLEDQFEDASGNMYKPDGPGASFTEFDSESFAKKSNQDAADFSDVQALFDALHAPREDAAAWRRDLEQRFDVDNFLRVLAFSRATGHWDGYGVMAHNYYLYGDPARDGKLVWISWDHNLTWQPQGMMNGPFGSLSVMMDEVKDSWPLIRYLLDDDVYRERYRAALDEFLHGAYEKERFDARAAELHALVAPFVSDEAKPFTTLDEPEAFESALSELSHAADERRADVVDALR